MPDQVAKVSICRDDVVTLPEAGPINTRGDRHMSSGWPHTEDGWDMSDQRRTPLGPEVSWPTGYPAMGDGDGDYRYPAERPADGPGRHPYAAFDSTAFDSAGYGDDGYHDPGYQGPAAQDAGIAGTRTVRGFVESGQGQTDYRDAGYAGSSYLPPAAGTGYGQLGYAGSSYAASDEIGAGYPPAAEVAAVPHGADLYKQPWDYDQPLRYDGEDDSYLPD